MMKHTLLIFLLSLFITCLLPPLGSTGTLFYEYDDAHRLIRVEKTGEYVIDYTYDEAGNRTTKVVQLESPSFDYDQDGDVDGLDLADFISCWDGTPQALSDFAGLFGSN